MSKNAKVEETSSIEEVETTEVDLKLEYEKSNQVLDKALENERLNKLENPDKDKPFSKLSSATPIETVEYEKMNTTENIEISEDKPKKKRKYYPKKKKAKEPVSDSTNSVKAVAKPKVERANSTPYTFSPKPSDKN